MRDDLFCLGPPVPLSSLLLSLASHTARRRLLHKLLLAMPPPWEH